MKPTITLPPYPEELADWWWKQTVQQWPEHGQEKILNLLRQEIVRQSDRFNKTRDFDPSSYGARDLSILAYGTFFTPRTFAACGFSLAEAFNYRGWRAPGKGPIRILDLGCGSGASSFAALYYLRSWGIKNSISLDAWDYSGKSLNFLNRIHRENLQLWKDTKINSERKDLRHLDNASVKGGYDIILSSYALNEWLEGSDENHRAELFSTLGSLLKENGYLLLLEPAEGDVCRYLHGASAKAVMQNKRLYIQAPYFSGMACPLWQNGSKYFSHEVRDCIPPTMVEQINHPLNLEIREVKFGMSILSRSVPRPIDEKSGIFRIISPVRKRKGTISLWGIGPCGNEVQYEWQRRDLSKDAQKSLLSLQRGDIIESQHAIDMDESRVRLQSANDIHPHFLPRWGQIN
jgi:SAM-dependent methyltransferase